LRRAPRYFEEAKMTTHKVYYGTYDWYPAVWTDLEGWMYVDTKWNRIGDPIVLFHQARVLSKEEFRYHYPDLEIPIKDQTGDKPEIRFGEYASFPCIWDTEAGEDGLHEAFIYVDGHWNKVRLEARTVWNELRPLPHEEWCKNYPDVPVAEPFVALVESQNRRHVRH
jgi:hypothetical protein